MGQTITVWFDPEADFLEVKFSEAPGYFRETNNDAIMERVDQAGQIIGFSILNVSHLAPGQPVVAQLKGMIRPANF